MFKFMPVIRRIIMTALNQDRNLLLCTISLFVTVLALSGGNANTCDNNFPDVENARPSGNNTPPFPVNSIINYRCNYGYESTAGVIRAKCTLEGGSTKWVLSDSRCRRISCAYPGDIDNGRRIGEDFRFAKNVTYKCYTGYELIGLAVIYCGADSKWTDSPPTCKIVSCDRPPKLQNGSVAYTSMVYKSKAVYSCDNSFHFVGTSDKTITRECLANKTWSGSVPQCKEILCPPLPSGPDIIVTDLTPDPTRHHVGKRVYFKCEDEPNVEATECTEYGTWTIVPGCGKIATAKPTEPPPHPTEAPPPPTKAPPPQSSTESSGIGSAVTSLSLFHSLLLFLACHLAFTFRNAYLEIACHEHYKAFFCFKKY